MAFLAFLLGGAAAVVAWRQAPADLASSLSLSLEDATALRLAVLWAGVGIVALAATWVVVRSAVGAALREHRHAMAAGDRGRRHAG